MPCIIYGCVPCWGGWYIIQSCSEVFLFRILYGSYIIRLNFLLIFLYIIRGFGSSVYFRILYQFGIIYGGFHSFSFRYIIREFHSAYIIPAFLIAIFLQLTAENLRMHNSADLYIYLGFWASVASYTGIFWTWVYRNIPDL